MANLDDYAIGTDPDDFTEAPPPRRPRYPRVPPRDLTGADLIAEILKILADDGQVTFTLTIRSGKG